MTEKPMILAFDTSCYTTSIALLDDEGRLLADKRRLLPVEQGVCGLRQSDALFKHLQALPGLLKEVLPARGLQNVRAVAVSTRPRPRSDSYMPVFLAGEQAARLLSLAVACPCWDFSHQEGHIAAALWSGKLAWREPFLAAHLSGGTSELLLATPREAGFDLKIVGGSDLPAGQFIDRVGVALGLPFPAGPALEQLALSAPPTALRLKGSLKGAEMSFSGPESAAQRLIGQGVEATALAGAVFDNIGQSLGKALQAAAAASE
jgi:N6-L-threonylcarbamoyladenine synthase